MGGVITETTYRKAETQEELMRRLAQIMKERYGASLYVFGSRARGSARPNSDYDVVAVAEAFTTKRRTERVRDRFSLWLEAGGWGQSLDLHCLTPDEFRRQTRSGMGYLGQAWKRGELRLIKMDGRFSTK